MVLTYPGGIRLPMNAKELKTELRLTGVGQVYLLLGGAEETYTLEVNEGENVLAGARIAVLGDGTPIYASVAGKVSGVFEKDGMHYLAVESDTELNTEVRRVREPETKCLAEMQSAELLEAVKTLGIWDVWSGDWLWRRAERAMGKIRRVVIDTTDDSGWSVTGYRTALSRPGDLLNGAKVLLHLLGATRIILVTDRERPKTHEAFSMLNNDPKLVALTQAEVKYPMCEETLYNALYVRRIPNGKHAEDMGVFFLRAQTAVALYDAILTGKPQTERVLTACGEGFGKNALLHVPLGTTWKAILAAAQFKGGAYETMVGSPLSGEKALGVPSGKAEAVLAALPEKRREAHCISCGRCAAVCPTYLQPFRILNTKNYRTVKTLAYNCIGCGCCDYICPSQISLRERILKNK